MIISDLSQKSLKVPRPWGGHSQEFNEYIQRLGTFYSTGPSKRVLALFAHSRGPWLDPRIK